jgi:hypothetical protein
MEQGILIRGASLTLLNFLNGLTTLLNEYRSNSQKGGSTITD